MLYGELVIVLLSLTIAVPQVKNKGGAGRIEKAHALVSRSLFGGAARIRSEPTCRELTRFISGVESKYELGCREQWLERRRFPRRELGSREVRRARRRCRGRIDSA